MTDTTRILTYTPDGAITGVIICEPDLVEANVPDGEQWIESDQEVDQGADRINPAQKVLVKNARTRPPVHYKAARRALYSTPGDQLGAIWKALELLKQQGMDIGPEAEQVLAQINDTKARHPKT